MEKLKKQPKYAPGMDDKDIIPPALEEDVKENNFTRETRMFFDEYDPSDIN